MNQVGPGSRHLRDCIPRKIAAMSTARIIKDAEQGWLWIWSEKKISLTFGRITSTKDPRKVVKGAKRSIYSMISGGASSDENSKKVNRYHQRRLTPVSGLGLP